MDLKMTQMLKLSDKDIKTNMVIISEQMENLSREVGTIKRTKCKI